MYEVFYNLKAEPFRLSPDHKFCYEHKGYAKARAYMAYAFKRAEGFVMITGRPGTGKTTLVGELVESMSADSVETANLVCTQLQADDLLKTVAFSFGVGSAEMDKAELLQRLTTLFQRWHHEGRRALLIVDEAQDLAVSAMEELRLLTNIQIGGQPLVQIFLLGQPELRDLVMAPEMEQVHQRVIAASHLRGLAVEETENYVVHRLVTSGWNGDPAIDRAIFPLVHKFSEGVPRRINLICSRLLLLGSVEERHAIEVEDVRAVIGELQAENLAAGTWLSEADFDFAREPDWLRVPGVTEAEPQSSEPESQDASEQSDGATVEETGDAAEDDTATKVAKKKEAPLELKEEASLGLSETPSPVNVLKAIPPAAAAAGGSDSLAVVALTEGDVSHGTTEGGHSIEQPLGGGSVVAMAPGRDEAASASLENEHAYVSRDFLDGSDEAGDLEDDGEEGEDHPAPNLGDGREETGPGGEQAQLASGAQTTDDDRANTSAANEAPTHLDEDAPGQQWPQTSRREANVSSLLGEQDVGDDVDAEPVAPAASANAGSSSSKLRSVIVLLILLALIAATVFFLEIFLSRNDDEARQASQPAVLAPGPSSSQDVPSSPPSVAPSALGTSSTGESDMAVPPPQTKLDNRQDDAARALAELEAPTESTTSLASALDSELPKSDPEESVLPRRDPPESEKVSVAEGEPEIIEVVSASSIEDEVEESPATAEAPEAIAVAPAISTAKTVKKRTAAKPKTPSLPVLKQVFEIGFTSEGANLLPDATAVLNKAAEKMHDYPDSTATITAYAAGQGDGATVGEIFDRRRKGVQNYLMLAGIDQNRLELVLDNASRGSATATGEGSSFVQVVVSRVLR